MALLDNLISHWPLDQIANQRRYDAHGQNNLQDPTTVAQIGGKLHNAPNFVGSSDEYLETEDSASSLSFGDTSFTVAGWVWFDSGTLTVNRRMFSKWGSLGNEYTAGFENSSSEFRWVVRNSDDAGNTIVRASGVTINTGQWHFVACWHDAENDQIGIQIDNGTEFTLPFTGGIQTTNNGDTFRVGAIDTGLDPGSTLDGRVDELSVWGRVLSSSEKSSLYNSGNALKYPFGERDESTSFLKAIVSHWTMDEGTAPNGDDSRHDSHAANTMGQPDVALGNDTGTGKIDNAARFEERDILSVERTDIFSPGDNEFTISFWVNFIDPLDSEERLIAKWSDSSGDREYLFRYITSSDRFQLLFRNSDDLGNTTLLADNFGAATHSTWYFCVFWHDPDANTMNIQINNGDVDSTAFSGGIQTTNVDQPLTIGGTSGEGTASNTSKADALIDEVAYWNRILTSKEKTELYNGGNGLTYPFSFPSNALFMLGP